MTKQELINAIHDFLKSERIKKALPVIKECHMTGWENWLQIEFGIYLQGHEIHKINRWDREFKIDYFSETSETKHIIPDFWVSDSDNYEDKNAYFLIEFKRNNSGNLLSEMKKDVSKWVDYTIHHGSELLCRGYARSENSGVFFVGLDMTPNDNEVTCPLIRQLEPHHHEESNSRIYFLDPNNLPSN